MDELTPKLETDEYIVLKGQSEPKGTFIDGNFTNLVYSLFGIFCMTKLCIIKFCGITFFSKVISLIFFICIYALYVFILHRICLKSDKYQYYWITNKNFYYKNHYSSSRLHTDNIQKIRLSDIYECKSSSRFFDLLFHSKSLTIKYNTAHSPADVKFDDQCEQLLKNPQMQKLLNNAIKSAGYMKVEIRHLEDCESVIAAINAKGELPL